jgi:general secretion pathway protein B
MSFILDALRKSEHERQRQGGPGLAEVAVAAPKTKTSVWAAAAVVLLVANLIAVGVLMLRRGRAPDATDAASIATASRSPTASQAPVAAPANVPAASAAPQTSPANPPMPATTSPPPGEQTAGLPPMLQPADGQAPGAGTRNPLEYEVAGGPVPADPVLAERGASVPAGPPAVTEYPTQPGSVVYEPLPEAAGTAAETVPDLPTIDDVALQGGVPEMHVDLHVYSTNPQDRFVFVNKRKYREGETLQEGPRVEEITRSGVVLSQQGRRFILPRQ